MEVKKIPSWYERQQVDKMASSLGLIVYNGFPYDETDSGALIPHEDTDRHLGLLNGDGTPMKIIPYKMTFYELKDKLIAMGAKLEEVNY